MNHWLVRTEDYNVIYLHKSIFWHFSKRGKLYKMVKVLFHLLNEFFRIFSPTIRFIIIIFFFKPPLWYQNRHIFSCIYLNGIIMLNRWSLFFFTVFWDKRKDNFFSSVFFPLFLSWIVKRWKKIIEDDSNLRNIVSFTSIFQPKNSWEKEKWTFLLLLGRSPYKFLHHSQRHRLILFSVMEGGQEPWCPSSQYSAWMDSII